MIFLVAVAIFLPTVFANKDPEFWENVPQDYLKWNYSHMNPSCTSAGGSRNPCQDIRLCNFALASVSMGGWPTLCGFVGKGVSKVCCGLPLVLGERLMKRVEEEKARNRECGRTSMSLGLSPTENKFFMVAQSIPPPDTSNPEKYDPPLDLSVESFLIPPARSSGEEVSFPWMVAIYRGSEVVCGGTLIDRNHVLSAANCFTSNGENPDLYTVKVGDLSAGEGYPYTLLDIKVHEDYVPNDLNNNIAILTLSDEILSPLFPNICLPSPGLANQDFTGSKATHLEWNNTPHAGSRGLSPSLHVAEDIPVLSMDECKEAYRRLNMNITSSMGNLDNLICAGISDGEGEDCKVSAGGPLMYQNNPESLPSYHSSLSWVQLGIASYGYHCGVPDTPVVYTKVSGYTDWINQNVKSSIHPQ